MRSNWPQYRPLLLLAVAIAAIAGGLAARTSVASAPPAAAHSVGPTPEREGSPLTDVCSRRVGCLLR